MPSPDLSHQALERTPRSPEVERILAVITPEPVGDDRFAIDVSDHMHGRLFGGLVAAQALRAAYTTVAPGRRAQSAHAYFLRWGRPEIPVEFEVHRDTDGRSFSARRVAAIQEGRPIFTMVCSFHEPEDTVEILQPMPEAVPAPTSWPLEPLHSLGGSFEMRHAAIESSVAHDRRIPGRLWVRAAGPLPDDPIVHDCLTFYVSDLGTPWNVSAPADMKVVTSLDHSVWLHRPTRMDEWHYVDLAPVALVDARGFYTGRMWDRSGAHVASIAQENLIRPLPA